MKFELSSSISFRNIEGTTIKMGAAELHRSPSGQIFKYSPNTPKYLQAHTISTS